MQQRAWQLKNISVRKKNLPFKNTQVSKIVLYTFYGFILLETLTAGFRNI